MAKRKCDACGKEKELSGGKTCEKGHFHCSSCAQGRDGCRLCGKKLK